MRRALQYPAISALVIGLAACGAASKPIPQGTVAPATVATSPVKAKVTTKAPEPAAPKVSTCDVVREAILTGTPAQIEAAMKALQADKTADGTAREYARYYLVRDAQSKDNREMDTGLITMACS